MYICLKRFYAGLAVVERSYSCRSKLLAKQPHIAPIRLRVGETLKKRFYGRFSWGRSKATSFNSPFLHEPPAFPLW